MPGCEKCTSRRACPDPLAVYSQVCLGMPGMAQCSKLFQMCEGAAGETFKALCDGGEGGGSALPPMKMYMHSSISEIILFKEWVPTTGGAYAGALLCVLLAAVAVQALKAWRVMLEVRWAQQRATPCCNPACGASADDPEGKDAVRSRSALELLPRKAGYITSDQARRNCGPRRLHLYRRGSRLRAHADSHDVQHRPHRGHSAGLHPWRGALWPLR